MKLFDFNKTVDYTKMKGCLGFLKIVYHNFSDLVLLNLAFVLTCLPLFTIGASYKALVETCQMLITDESAAPIRRYFKAFFSEFLKSTLYGIFFTVLFTIIAFAGAFYYNLAKQNIIFYLPAALCAASVIVLFMMVCWFFPLFLKIRQGFFATLANSFVLSFVNLKESVFYILLTLILSFVIWALLPYSVPIVFVLPFSATAFASAFITNEKIITTFNLK